MELIGKRRAIIILHPDFDQPGKAGVRAAAEYASQLVEGLKVARNEARKAGAPAELEAYLADFKHMVRVLPLKDLKR